MIWVGASAALGVAAKFQVAGIAPHGLTPATFLAIQLAMLLQFAVLVGLAVGFRRRSDIHKRLMLLATISILPPAVARFHLENYGVTGAYASTLLAYPLVVVAAGYDIRKAGRLHPAYLWGGISMLAWMFFRSAIGKTEGWQAIGEHLIN